MNIPELLNDARHEIISLRRRNEILSAKVEVFDSLMCLLHTSPAQHSQAMSPDVAWQIEKGLEELKTNQNQGSGIAAA